MMELVVAAMALGLQATGVEVAEVKPVCLILADGHVSEYAWGKYAENEYPPYHPGHEFFAKGLLQWKDRFARWLDLWDVRRIDLERHRGALRLDGVDLVILDDVRQSVCDPYELELVEFARQGGGLLVYAGYWGLGGCPKNEYCTRATVDSYRNTPLGEALPLEIVTSPDYILPADKPSYTPVFLDKSIGDGIATAGWSIYGLHVGKARGRVLAELDGQPFICENSVGKGHIVVYTGDDLGWAHRGAPCAMNRFSGALWRRLAAFATGKAFSLPVTADPEPRWEKPAAFAHPDQPMNFLWSGYFSMPAEMGQLLNRDLVTHSSTLCADPWDLMGAAGVLGWRSVGCPLQTEASQKDPETWSVGRDGSPIQGRPCFNNPKALANMDDAVARWAATMVNSRWIEYGHMGDETEFGLCACNHCKRAFEQELKYPLPEIRNDFSPQYLDKWIDYCLFRNRSVGQMYARAARAAHAANPRLKMFASLPQSGGTAHGDDQFHTQSGFDLLWDHTYPGTMAITVGLNASLMEETAVLQGRPYVPVFDLLQCFDSYDRAPRMPPPEYVREMVWQAIAHGVDSVGYFVYNAFWWVLPGSEAWEEAQRMAATVLEPLTPTLYEMRNVSQPLGLLYCYSQEAVDGLREMAGDDANPWKPVIRWWTHHATQEAYDVLKYAHAPFNVVSEHRLLEGRELPWKALVIPYAEHVHPKTARALQDFMARGGKVYMGANSTLDLAGVEKLPVSFDATFTTWWPKNRKEEWNQRRARAYLIGPLLQKAAQLRKALGPLWGTCDAGAMMIDVDDPEIVYNVREAGAAKYLFFVNDRQVNPTAPELRKKRQEYNHFMLMPQEFPSARAKATVGGTGWLYPLLGEPRQPVGLSKTEPITLDLSLDGGGGAAYVVLPRQIKSVSFVTPCARTVAGVTVRVRLEDTDGAIVASLPLRIDLECGGVRQRVYAATHDGELSWTVPFLRTFPEGAIALTVTDLVSGVEASSKTGPV